MCACLPAGSAASRRLARRFANLAVGSTFRTGGVDLTVAGRIKNQLSFAFILFDNAKSDAGGDKTRYLFRALGPGLMSQQPPQITPISQF
jgi:hypothetical protein